MKKISIEEHTKYINIALDMAFGADLDVPIAALIVKEGEIIASSVNMKEKNNDPTAHAEILVIKEAANKLGRWRLDDVVLYVTLEPCPMCAGAILFSRIPVIVFGAYDALYGSLGSVLNLNKLAFGYDPQIIGGVEEKRASDLLKDFFRNNRSCNH